MLELNLIQLPRQHQPNQLARRNSLPSPNSIVEIWSVRHEPKHSFSGCPPSHLPTSPLSLKQQPHQGLVAQQSIKLGYRDL